MVTVIVAAPLAYTQITDVADAMRDSRHNS
jgi:hypothetical protein